MYQWFLLSRQDCCGKDTDITTVVGRRGGRIQHGWTERKIGEMMWEVLRKEIDLEDPSPLLSEACFG